MDKKFDDLLCRKFPLLYADRRESMQNTCLCWGFEAGDGWYDLIDNLSMKLELLIEKYIKDYPYKPEFPSWIFGRWTKVSIYKHCYFSFLALWRWLMESFKLQEPEPWWPRAAQVKEKYGTLRFYMTRSTDEMEALISEAEHLSAKTCESCGKPGKIVGNRWLYCRCRKCFDKLKAKGYTLGGWNAR